MDQGSLHRAAIEYLRKRGSFPELVHTPDGYYMAPETDTCELCRYARWVVNTGSHLKTIQHVARKHGVTVKDLRSAISNMRETEVVDTSIAYKALRYTVEDGAPRLVSPSAQRDDGSSDWLPQSVTFASCSSQHEVPNESCGCGLYAFWYLENAIEYTSGSVVVRLRIGGKIIEGTEGCRAEAAVVDGIFVPPTASEKDRANLLALAELYQVEAFSEAANPFGLEILPRDEDDDE